MKIQLLRECGLCGTRMRHDEPRWDVAGAIACTGCRDRLAPNACPECKGTGGGPYKVCDACEGAGLMPGTPCPHTGTSWCENADCPECRQGKHGNCTGWALDPDTDEIRECGCAQGGHA